MSEKRFKVDYEVGVLDTLTNEIICDTVNAKEVVDLLNEQQATISALHEENTSFKESQDGKRRAILWWEHYKEKWVNAEKELRKLKEENEQLHYQIIDLQDKLGMSEKVIDV